VIPKAKRKVAPHGWLASMAKVICIDQALPI
jgi:hypothetical protein